MNPLMSEAIPAEEPTIVKKSPTKRPPTVEEVLNWAKKLNGVVMPEWARSPTRCKLARITFPEYRGSRKASTTSTLVKEAINAFYPFVEVKDTKKHSCKVTVQQEDRLFQVWILESNLPALPTIDEVSASDIRTMNFFPYGTCLRRSKKTIFLGVSDVQVLS